MWPTVSSRLVIGVAILSLAFAAGWYVNGQRLNAKHAEEARRFSDAALAVVKRREAVIEETNQRLTELERQKSKIRIIYRAAIRDDPECKAWSEQPISCPQSWR